MGAGQVITDFEPFEEAKVITDFQPVDVRPGFTPAAGVEIRDGRPYIPVSPKKMEAINAEGAAARVLEKGRAFTGFDLDGQVHEWYKGRDPEEEYPSDDVASILYPLARPFMAQGYTAAGALNQGLGVFSEHLDLLAEYVEKKTGLKRGGLFKQLAEQYEQNAQYWRERASEVGINFLDEMIGEAAGGAVPGIAEFMLNVPYAAALGAAEAEKQGKNEVAGALVEGAKRAVIGLIFKAIEPLQKFLKAPAMAGIFGVQAASEGAEPREIAKSVGTGLLYGATSRGGTMGLNDVRKNLRERAKLTFERIDAEAEAKKAEAGQPGEKTPPASGFKNIAESGIEEPMTSKKGAGETPTKETPKTPEGGIIPRIKTLIEQDESAEMFGLRVIPRNHPAKVGETLRSSFKWVDNERTNKRLSGTSAIGIEESVTDALREIHSPQLEYEGDTIALVRGTFAKKGQDPGEVLLRQPKVVALFNKKDIPLLRPLSEGEYAESIGIDFFKISPANKTQDVAGWDAFILRYKDYRKMYKRLNDEDFLPKPSAPAGEAGGVVTPEVPPESPSELEALRKAEIEKERRGSVQIGKEPEKPTPFAWSDPKIEERYQKSVPVKPSAWWKVKDAVETAWHKISREYEELPKNAENANLRFRLKKLEKQKGVAAHNTAIEIAKELAALDKTEYDLFSRKVVMNDLANEMERGHELPWGFTPDTLKAEMQRLNQAIEQSDLASVSKGGKPRLQEALGKRSADWEKLRKEYIAAMKDINFDVEPMLRNESYFRHQVLSHVDEEGLYGSGEKLKTPRGRGFLKKREGGTFDINRDFLVPEELVKAQMRYDIEIAKTIRWIWDNESIHMKVKADAKAAGLKDWHDAIPPTHEAWSPSEGNMFYMADSIPGRLAKQLFEQGMEQIEVTKADLRPVLAVGRKSDELVVRREVAATLNEIQKKRSFGTGSKVIRELTKDWKVWQLTSPRRLVKYNIRNLSGDADATFVGNPMAFKRVPQAVKEIYNVFLGKKQMTPEMEGWFERGGMESTLQAQEIDGLRDVWLFSRFYEGQGVKPTEIPHRIWSKYWKTARMGTDMRESVLRYANYLEYLDQVKQNKGGVPKNFGASIPEEILALRSVEDRAYWLSNDLIGAYDRVSVMGQNMRDYWFPFWSWKEVNFKRYVQFAKNAAYNNQLAELVGKKALDNAEKGGLFIPTIKELEELRERLKVSKRGVAAAVGKKAATAGFIKTPLVAARIGGFIIKAVALQAALETFNRTVFPNEEEDLPDEERAKPHIVLGRDEEGKVLSFNRLGSLGDFVEWFGADESLAYHKKWMNGEMTLAEIAVDMAKSPVNIMAQNLRPDVKTIGELIEGRQIFPDVFSPSPIKDRMLHLARHLGLENEYIEISGLPSKGYEQSLKHFLLYSTDPGQASYSEIMDAKRRYMAREGKGAEGFWLTPKGLALYNLKLALRYGDDKAYEKYMAEYYDLGGTARGIRESIDRMHPLSGLSREDRRKFKSSLSDDQLNRLEKAMDFYSDTLRGGKQKR